MRNYYHYIALFCAIILFSSCLKDGGHQVYYRYEYTFENQYYCYTNVDMKRPVYPRLVTTVAPKEGHVCFSLETRRPWEVVFYMEDTTLFVVDKRYYLDGEHASPVRDTLHNKYTDGKQIGQIIDSLSWISFPAKQADNDKIIGVVNLELAVLTENRDTMYLKDGIITIYKAWALHNWDPNLIKQTRPGRTVE